MLFIVYSCGKMDSWIVPMEIKFSEAFKSYDNLRTGIWPQVMFPCEKLTYTGAQLFTSNSSSYSCFLWILSFGEPAASRKITMYHNVVWYISERMPKEILGFTPDSFSPINQLRILYLCESVWLDSIWVNQPSVLHRSFTLQEED